MEEPSPMGAPRVSHEEPLGSNDLLHRLRVELAPDLEVRRYLGDEQFGRLYLAWEPALPSVDTLPGRPAAPSGCA
jgi:hypothetical protein